MKINKLSIYLFIYLSHLSILRDLVLVPADPQSVIPAKNTFTHTQAELVKMLNLLLFLVSDEALKKMGAGS